MIKGCLSPSPVSSGNLIVADRRVLVAGVEDITLILGMSSLNGEWGPDGVAVRIRTAVGLLLPSSI
jgi:hypothetical protein